ENNVGNVIGNLFFSWVNVLYNKKENEKFVIWVKSAIEDIISLTKQKFEIKFDEIVSLPLYNSIFKEQYINKIIADSFGYAGTEIIRRVVGDSKVQELDDVTDLSKKIPMERALIMMGSNLIQNRFFYKSGSEIVKLFSEIIGN
ncbi:MAG: S-methyl-5-thioribose kinase, partial [Sphaerochaetaceae bacterium]|nr:S-methyl-5-thioribose kinase [Sphaerochaetaceae bacterium]